MSGEKTRWIFDNEETQAQHGTEQHNTAPLYSGLETQAFDTEMTVPFGSGAEKTQIWNSARPQHADIAQEAATADDVPVVGWLAIVKGPGLGRAVPLGAGVNAIGRDWACRAPFPFGDNLISGTDHLRIVYDDEMRNFLALPGTGKNVSRIEKEIIAVPTRLKSYEVIHLSKVTSVMFVPLCGEHFDWADLAPQE